MFCISFATSIQKKYIGFPSLNRSNTALLSQYLASWFKQISVKPFVFHFVKTCNFSDWQNKLTITINAYHYHRHMNNKNNTLHNKIQHLLIQWQWWIKSWFLFNCGMNLGKFGNCLLVFIGLRTPFRSLSCLVPESLSALCQLLSKLLKLIATISLSRQNSCIDFPELLHGPITDHCLGFSLELIADICYNCRNWWWCTSFKSVFYLAQKTQNFCPFGPTLAFL